MELITYASKIQSVTNPKKVYRIITLVKLNIGEEFIFGHDRWRIIDVEEIKYK